MKKLLLTTAIAASLAGAISADTRLPEYAQVTGVSTQVEGVSNQVAAANTKLTETSLDVEAIKSLMLGSESASPYLGGIRCIINATSAACIPEGAEYYKALAGAYIAVQLPNEYYKVDVTSLESNAVVQIFVPCIDFVDAKLRLVPGHADHIYSEGEQLVHVRQGEITEVYLNTIPPLNPARGDEGVYRMVGRAQYYDPDNTYGKQSTGESFPIQRVYDPDTEAWVTQFGYYSNSIWHTECDIYNLMPQFDTSGGMTNSEEVGGVEGLAAHAYENAAFPWCEAKRVAIVVNDAMLNLSAATPATNVFWFSRVPIYAYKETIETLTITNFAANGSVSSVGAYPLQIKWVARPEITNGYDNAFYIPSWEKVYARDCTTNENDEVEWTTREIGVKEANYYACYKTSPTSAGNANWFMTGGTGYAVQSYPWPYRNGSNYGVWGCSRAGMHARSANMNSYDCSLYSTSGTNLVEEIGYFPAPVGDMASRRWAGNNWHDYEAFRVLAYIQFSANTQSTGTYRVHGSTISHPIGIYGNNTTSVAENRQDDLEFYYGAQPSTLTFLIAPAQSNGYAFSWLGILNFWGSEGDQMADVTVITETDSDGTKSAWYFANLDRSRWIPDSSGTATSYAIFTDRGYERLSYYWAYTGLPGSYYRGKDTKAEYAAFSLVRTTPTVANEIFGYNINSSPYDGVYLGTYPATPVSGSAYSYWMCSLSINRDYAIGPWSVYSNSGPSSASAYTWGGRASPNFLGAEREARSGAE